MTNSILKSVFNIKLFDFDTKLSSSLNSGVFEGSSVKILNSELHKNVLEDFSIPRSLDAGLSPSNIIKTNLSDYGTLQRVTNGLEAEAFNPIFPSLSTYSTISRINPNIDDIAKYTSKEVDPEYSSRNIDSPKHDNTLPPNKTTPGSAYSDDGFGPKIKLAGNEYTDANPDLKLAYKGALKAAMKEHWSDYEDDIEKENDYMYPFLAPPSLPKLANTGSNDDDTFYNQSFKQNLGEIAKIIGAVLGKESIFDKELVGIGIESLDKGASLENFALETIAETGNSSYDEVVNLLWSNVIGTNPTPEQARPFIDILEREEKSIAELAVYASETLQNQENIKLVGLNSTGIEYIEFIDS